MYDPYLCIDSISFKYILWYQEHLVLWKVPQHPLSDYICSLSHNQTNFNIRQQQQPEYKYVFQWLIPCFKKTRKTSASGFCNFMTSSKGKIYFSAYCHGLAGWSNGNIWQPNTQHPLLAICFGLRHVKHDVCFACKISVQHILCCPLEFTKSSSEEEKQQSWVKL